MSFVFVNPATAATNLNSGSCGSIMGGVWAGNTNTCTISTNNPKISTDIQINPGTTLIINSGVTVTIQNGITITNFGTITNSYAIISNSGIISNTGTITNTGTISNSGIISNTGTITNTGTISNSGTITNNNPGTITNTGTITNYGSIINTGTIYNYALSYGIISNYGTISNAGTIYNYYYGKIPNSGIITNTGTIISTGSFTNKYYYKISNLGTISNSGTFSNSGIIENACGAIITGSSPISGNPIQQQTPCITAPAAVTVEATGTHTTVSLGSPRVSDISDPSPSVTNNAPAGGFPIGATTVIWTAKDKAGNSATATQLVTVHDTTPPILTAPGAITREATGPLTAVSLGTATAVDLVDGTVAVSNNAPASFPVGMTTVTYSAIDAHGNKATAIQTVTITDTTPPAITAPSNVIVEATVLPVPKTQINLGTATATDVNGIISITNDAPATFGLGDTTVTWTATDGSGLTATATQKVTVKDTTTSTVTPLIKSKQVISSKGGVVTLNIDEGNIAELVAFNENTIGGTPDNVNLPYGMFEFKITSLNNGQSVTLTMTFPENLPANTAYWKFGPTKNNMVNHWYQLSSFVSGKSLTFTLTDGEDGDDDLIKNGEIIDAGGAGGTASPGANIPEFPTLALPVISVISLLFLFKRKRMDK